MNNFGIIGLGVMGTNLGRNFAHNGYQIAGYDLSDEKRQTFTQSETALTSFDLLPEYYEPKPLRCNVILAPYLLMQKPIPIKLL